MRQLKIQFYTLNTLGFLFFTSGTILTFLSILRIGEFGNRPQSLVIALTFLIIGSCSSTLLNNFGPRKFRPRNGALGVCKNSIDAHSCLKEIGQRVAIKTRLSNTKRQLLASNFDTIKSNLLRLWYGIATAFPFGLEYGERHTHQLNRAIFQKNKVAFKTSRPTILKQLFKITKNQSFHSNECITLFDQWLICQQLGIDAAILNLYNHELNNYKRPKFKSSWY